MPQFNNITLIGTSHISKESVDEIKTTFHTLKPEIVAIELDANRAYGLKHKVKRPKNLALLKALGVIGFLFYVVGEYVQRKLGNIVSFEPGSDMKTALILGEKHKCNVALIDRDIQITLRRLSKYFKKREIFKILFDIVKGFFSKTGISIDISKKPTDEIILYAIEHTKKRYPSLYKILVHERDVFMAKQLHVLSKAFPDQNILAVVGAGHLKGMLTVLEKLEKTANVVKIKKTPTS